MIVDLLHRLREARGWQGRPESNGEHHAGTISAPPSQASVPQRSRACLFPCPATPNIADTTLCHDIPHYERAPSPIRVCVNKNTQPCSPDKEADVKDITNSERGGAFHYGSPTVRQPNYTLPVDVGEKKKGLRIKLL